MMCCRREWIAGMTASAAGHAAFGPPLAKEDEKQRGGGDSKLGLEDYEPKSMLHVPETHVPRSRFPVIDFHTHLTWIDRKGKTDVVHHNATPEEILKVMDAKNIRIMVNLTGGYDDLLKETIRHWQQPHPDRFVVFTEPWYAKISMPNYSPFQVEQIEAAKKAGARGLKILKTLGLYL